MIEKIIIWIVIFFAVGLSLLVTIFTGSAHGNKTNGAKNFGNIFFAVSFYVMPIICILAGVAASTQYLGYTYLWLTVIPGIFILWFLISVAISR